MAFLNKAKRVILLELATECGLSPNPNDCRLNLITLIVESDVFDKDYEFVSDLYEAIVEEREEAEAKEQARKDRAVAEERKRELRELDLELERLKKERKAEYEKEQELRFSEHFDFLPQLKVPTRFGNWKDFFELIERIFVIYKTPAEWKGKIVLRKLGRLTKSLGLSNLIDYVEIKGTILEWNRFKKEKKQNSKVNSGEKQPREIVAAVTGNFDCPAVITSTGVNSTANEARLDSISVEALRDAGSQTVNTSNCIAVVGVEGKGDIPEMSEKREADVFPELDKMLSPRSEIADKENSESKIGGEAEQETPSFEKGEATVVIEDQLPPVVCVRKQASSEVGTVNGVEFRLSTARNEGSATPFPLEITREEMSAVDCPSLCEISQESVREVGSVAPRVGEMIPPMSEPADNFGEELKNGKDEGQGLLTSKREVLSVLETKEKNLVDGLGNNTVTSDRVLREKSEAREILPKDQRSCIDLDKGWLEAREIVRACNYVPCIVDQHIRRLEAVSFRVLKAEKTRGVFRRVIVRMGEQPQEIVIENNWVGTGARKEWSSALGFFNQFRKFR